MVNGVPGPQALRQVPATELLSGDASPLPHNPSCAPPRIPGSLRREKLFGRIVTRKRRDGYLFIRLLSPSATTRIVKTNRKRIYFGSACEKSNCKRISRVSVTNTSERSEDRHSVHEARETVRGRPVGGRTVGISGNMADGSSQRSLVAGTVHQDRNYTGNSPKLGRCTDYRPACPEHLCRGERDAETRRARRGVFMATFAKGSE